MGRISKLNMAVLIATSLASTGCFMYHEREKVLIPGIDVDQSLDVAEVEITNNEWHSVLTIWAVRDQLLDQEQADTAALEDALLPGLKLRDLLCPVPDLL